MSDEPDSAWAKYVEDGKLTFSEVRDAIKNLSDSEIKGLRNYVQTHDIETPDGVSATLRGAVDTVSDPVGTAVDAVINTIITPLYKGFYLLFAILVALVGVLFLGTDLALGSEVVGFPGLADVPVLVANMAIDALAPVGSTALDGIRGINVQLISVVTGNTGVAAAPLLAALQAIELGVLLYLLMFGYETMRSAVPIPLP